jgi:Nickel uptake substrate-specific transmembrane region.
LLAEGDAPGPGARFDTPLAFRYEIVPQTNPYQMKNDEMRVVVLYEGKPLPNALARG